MRSRSIALAFAVVALLAGLLAGMYSLGAHYETPLGAANSVRLNQWLVIAAWLITGALFKAFVAIGIDDWGRGWSTLYLPWLLVSGGLLGVLTPAAIGSVDLLMHDTRHWTFVLDPDNRLVTTGFFVVMVAGLGWLFWVLALGRRRT